MPTQALTLAREWIISVLCWKLNLDWLVVQVREQLALALRSHGHERNPIPNTQYPNAQTCKYRDALAGIADGDKLVRAFDRIGELRNTIAHGGMSRHGAKAEHLFRNVSKMEEQLKELLAFLN
jgi:hypothetical protein